MGAGEEEEVVVMILYVDLKCCSCYKKVKKLLRKFPQIRDQVFDEAQNKVIITVICCNPEKLRDKLCCKGGNAIQAIEIVEKQPPPKPPQKPHKPKPPPPPVLVPVVEMPKPEKPKEPEKPKADPHPVVLVPAPKPDPPPPKKPQPQPQPPPEAVKKMPDPVPPRVPQPHPQPQPQPEPVWNMPMMPDPMYGDPFCPPVSVCCQECYEGRGGGPCHYGYGRPPPGPCYDYGYQYRPCYPRCDLFSEDNPQGCSIM